MKWREANKRWFRACQLHNRRSTVDLPDVQTTRPPAGLHHGRGRCRGMSTTYAASWRRRRARGRDGKRQRYNTKESAIGSSVRHLGGPYKARTVTPITHAAAFQHKNTARCARNKSWQPSVSQIASISNICDSHPHFLQIFLFTVDPPLRTRPSDRVHHTTIIDPVT